MTEDFLVQQSLKEMTEDGLNVSRETLETLITERTRMKEDLCQLITKRTGRVVTNANSAAQLQDFFENVCDEKLTRMTKTNKPSFDKVTLKNLAIKYPIAEQFAEFRSLVKECSMLARVKKDLDSNSKLKPAFKIGTSGRIFAENPNVVGLPAIVRKAIIPQDGHVFISADYKAQELMICAHFASQHDLVEQLTADLDIFAPIAEELHADKSAAKAIIYAMFYGQTEDQAAQAQGISVLKAREIRQAFYRKYPLLRGFITALRRSVEKQRCGKSLLSHRQSNFKYSRPNSAQLDEDIRRAVNHVIQGTGADIMHEVIRQYVLDSLPKFVKMKLTVFDACLFEVPEDLADEGIRVISDLMHFVPKTLGIPQKVKCSVGHDWYECTK